MRRLKSLLSDAFWLYVLPASAIALPWSWYFALCRRMARGRHPYRAAIERELEYARQVLPDLDVERFAFEQALVKLVDAADFYLNLVRTHRWFRRHVRVIGRWPDPGQPMLLLGSHWGAGHWIWGDLRRQGIRAWFLARQSTAADFGRGRLALWYGQFRGWGMRRAGCAGVITTGGALAKAQDIFNRAEALVALNDVPTSADHSGMDASLLGHRVSLPTGLIDLAMRREAAVAWFYMELDMERGKRVLHVNRSSSLNMTTRSIIDSYARDVNDLIGRRPGSWQTWALAPALFGDLLAIHDDLDAQADSPLERSQDDPSPVLHE